METPRQPLPAFAGDLKSNFARPQLRPNRELFDRIGFGPQVRGDVARKRFNLTDAIARETKLKDRFPHEVNRIDKEGRAQAIKREVWTVREQLTAFRG